MSTFRLTHLATTVRRGLRARIAALRATGDAGSHAVEYAIGIGLGAAAILAVFTAYRLGLTAIITSWIFTN
jgi:hypothetical protein